MTNEPRCYYHGLQGCSAMRCKECPWLDACIENYEEWEKEKEKDGDIDA